MHFFNFSCWGFCRFHKGDVLITASTGMMTEAEGEKWGLVPTHAYAVLDIREFKVTPYNFLLFVFLIDKTLWYHSGGQTLEPSCEHKLPRLYR